MSLPSRNLEVDMLYRWAGVLLASLLVSVEFARAESANLGPLLESIRAVEREGKGNRRASQAWAQLTASAKAEQLPAILSAMDGAGPLAVNWLRASVDAIAEREPKAKKPLPLASLESFLADKRHDQRARRLAFEWIASADPAAPDRLIPGMLDDPSLELRRDAVARILKPAESALAAGKNDKALSGFKQALGSARDLDQVKTITEALKKLGQPVDLPSHFGFVQDWYLIGPFDNIGGKGFDVAFPPETEVSFAAGYETPSGTLSWKREHTGDEYGQVDLNKLVGKHMGAAAYAACEFLSEQPHDVELRLGSENANKVWLNGKLLSSANVYHANGTMDQYVGAGRLKQGRNLILLKICQNEQKEEWAQEWKFQLRVCDPSGKAILASDRDRAISVSSARKEQR
jgi:hypothetical protein